MPNLQPDEQLSPDATLLGSAKSAAEPAAFGTGIAFLKLAGACTNPILSEVRVLWTIFVILLIAWMLGLVGVYNIGSLVWLLLVAALIALVFQLISGRRTVI